MNGMTQAELKILLNKYRQNSLTAEEKSRLDRWYLYQAKNAESLNDPGIYEKRMAEMDAALSFDKDIPIKNLRLWPKIAVAAAAIAAIVSGIYFFNGRFDRSSETGADISELHYVQNDIAPGKNGATITLASGKTIRLSETKTGVVIGSELKYDDSTAVAPGAELAENVLQQLIATTARGQTYAFILPDGTKVWLNSDSKLEFPSDFDHATCRVVKLSGEGYFEVAKDKTHPFRVISGGQELEVLGTHFNVNCYSDEPAIGTTLLEGSVKINNKVVLKPNQQALTSKQGIKVIDVDAGIYTDWKDGMFTFSNERIEAVMRRIGRWYNVEVEYQGRDKGSDTYSGTVSRFDNISGVLKLLEENAGLHFKVTGNKVTVLLD
jgi:transmembrane sensor